MTVIINNTTIDPDDIVKYGFTEAQVTSNQVLIASQCSLYIDIASEEQKDKYDDTRLGSLFYGTYWVNSKFEIFDDNDETIFAGRIKNIEIDYDNNTLSIEATNYIKELVDTLCIYSATGLTPAEHIQAIILNVLDDYDLSDRVATSSFAIVAGKQSGYTCSITYTKEDNVSCINVINELLDMSSCDIYDVDSILNIKQWEQWEDIQGYKVSSEQYVSSYKHWYGYDEIINDINIAYKSGASVTRYTNSDSQSISEYGATKTYNCPDSGDSTTPSDYNILWDNLSSATWAGAKKITHYKDVIKRCSFKVSDEMSYVKLYDQLDLNICGNINEPVRVTKITPDLENHAISFECVFLNLPKSPVTIDRTPPEAVEIDFGYMMNENSIGILWTVSPESDSLGYYIYYSTTPGNWHCAASSEGCSPIEVKNPPLINGYCFHEISGLSEGATYYFKIKAFDNRYNLSEDSNIYSVRLYSQQFENQYRTTGDMLTGISLDESNSNSGSIPWYAYGIYDSSMYDSAVYAPSAQYRSYKLHSDTGFLSASFTATGNIEIQLSAYNNGSFIWSESIKASPFVTIDLEGETDILFLMTFNSEKWSDSDTIYLFNIQEA